MKRVNVKELEYLAFHDIMTGLRNRSYLYRKTNLSDYNFVYFIDINDMHEINKSGHFFGDKHILKCVKYISSFLDKKDLFVRYAGDEFIILSETDIDLKTNKDFSVGKTKKTSNDILKEIEKADREMLKSKTEYKRTKT